MHIVKKIVVGIGAIILLFVIVQIVIAAKYKMVVNVVEGENVLGVNPLADSLDFGDLSRDNGMTRYVALSNGGKMDIRVLVLKFGEISDLVKIDKTDFVLKPGESTKIAYEISIPPSAQVKKYSGWTIVFRMRKVF